MMLNIPQTLVKAGLFNKSLEEAVKKCRESLSDVPIGLGNTIKYATFKQGEEAYFLMVSQQKDRLVTSAGYNVLLTVTSYSDSINRQVADRFEKETGINLNINVPSPLRAQSELLGMSFQVFERNPEIAMDFLKGKI